MLRPAASAAGGKEKAAKAKNCQEFSNIKWGNKNEKSRCFVLLLDFKNIFQLTTSSQVRMSMYHLVSTGNKGALNKLKKFEDAVDFPAET